MTLQLSCGIEANNQRPACGRLIYYKELNIRLICGMNLKNEFVVCSVSVVKVLEETIYYIKKGCQFPFLGFVKLVEMKYFVPRDLKCWSESHCKRSFDPSNESHQKVSERTLNWKRLLILRTMGRFECCNQIGELPLLLDNDERLDFKVIKAFFEFEQYLCIGK